MLMPVTCAMPNPAALAVISGNNSKYSHLFYADPTYKKTFWATHLRTQGRLDPAIGRGAFIR